MTGTLTTTKGSRFIFRREEEGWLLWPWYSDYTRGVCHKAAELPKGTVELINVEEPPRTVSFTPLLTSY